MDRQTTRRCSHCDQPLAPSESTPRLFLAVTYIYDGRVRILAAHEASVISLALEGIEQTVSRTVNEITSRTKHSKKKFPNKTRRP